MTLSAAAANPRPSVGTHCHRWSPAGAAPMTARLRWVIHVGQAQVRRRFPVPRAKLDSRRSNRGRPYRPFMTSEESGPAPGDGVGPEHARPARMGGVSSAGGACRIRGIRPTLTLVQPGRHGWMSVHAHWPGVEGLVPGGLEVSAAAGMPGSQQLPYDRERGQLRRRLDSTAQFPQSHSGPAMGVAKATASQIAPGVINASPCSNAASGCAGRLTDSLREEACGLAPARGVEGFSFVRPGEEFGAFEQAHELAGRALEIGAA